MGPVSRSRRDHRDWGLVFMVMAHHGQLLGCVVSAVLGTERWAGQGQRSDFITGRFNFISALITFAALDMRRGLHCVCKLKGQVEMSLSEVIFRIADSKTSILPFTSRIDSF